MSVHRVSVRSPICRRCNTENVRFGHETFRLLHDSLWQRHGESCDEVVRMKRKRAGRGIEDREA